MSLSPSGYMMTSTEEKMFQILIDLVDENGCRFDHHGGCQEHGYLWLHDGQICPHREAKDLLTEYGFDWKSR